MKRAPVARSNGDVTETTSGSSTPATPQQVLARGRRHHANGVKTTMRSGDESTDAEATMTSHDDDVRERMARANSLPPLRSPKPKKSRVVLEKMATMNTADESSDVASDTSGVDRRRRSRRGHVDDGVTSQRDTRLKKRRSSVGVVSNDGSLRVRRERSGSRSRDLKRRDSATNDVSSDYAQMTAEDAAKIDVSKYYSRPTSAQQPPASNAHAPAHDEAVRTGSRRRRHSRRRAPDEHMTSASNANVSSANARDATQKLNDVTDCAPASAEVALETFRSADGGLDDQTTDNNQYYQKSKVQNLNQNTFML